MKAYRIKHIPTGLYYKPSNGMSNLSTKGKVYLTNSCGLLKDGAGLHCTVKKRIFNNKTIWRTIIKK